MQTLEMSLSHLVLTGVISYEDAVYRALVPKRSRRHLPGPTSSPSEVPTTFTARPLSAFIA